MSDEEMDVVIIGAGISGLVCGYRLAKSGARVMVIDSATRAGGVIHSTREDGFLLENGPNSFASSPVISNLLDELKLTAETQALPMRDHARYVWRASKLRRVPTGAMDFLQSDLLSLTDKFSIALGIIKWVPPPEGDIELGAYLRRRLGDGAVETLVKPGLAGIYAQDADLISFEAVMPKVFGHARRSRRLLDVAKGLKQEKARAGAKSTGPRSIIALNDGVEALVQRLVQEFENLGGRLELDTRANLASANGDSWRIGLSSGESYLSPHVVIATPAQAAAQLLDTIAPESARLLREIEYAAVTVVQVGLREDQLRENRPGFGFLAIRNQGLRALGIIWSDRMFAGRVPAGHRLLTCFYGGQIDPGVSALSNDELHHQVLADLKLSMGHDGTEPVLLRIVRLPSALPVFPVGHMRLVEKITKHLPDGMELLGSYLGGVSIPDRIGAAEGVAKRQSAALGNLHRVENLGLG